MAKLMSSACNTADQEPLQTDHQKAKEPAATKPAVTTKELTTPKSAHFILKVKVHQPINEATKPCQKEDIKAIVTETLAHHSQCLPIAIQVSTVMFVQTTINHYPHQQQYAHNDKVYFTLASTEDQFDQEVFPEQCL
jgi:hypothetical protein